jgi:hypothetical protein
MIEHLRGAINKRAEKEKYSLLRKKVSPPSTLSKCSYRLSLKPTPPALESPRNYYQNKTLTFLG